MTRYLLVIVAVLALLAGGVYLMQPKAGATDSTTITNPFVFQDDVTINDPLTVTDDAAFSDELKTDANVLTSYTLSTSTTGTAVTLDDSDLLYSTVVMLPNTGALTVTLPASSTLSSFIPNAGDRARQCWVNATSTAAGTINFAASTGIDLEKVATTTANTVGQAIVAAGGSACFEFLRIGAGSNASDILVQQTTYANAD